MTSPEEVALPEAVVRGESPQPVRLVQGEIVDRAEIVIGLVGALGTDMSAVESALSHALLSVGYGSDTVRVSELLSEFDDSSGGGGAAQTYIDDLMNKGDHLRSSAEHGGAAAVLAVAEIVRRRTAATESPEVERQGHATVIRQLKHPEEVRLLRSVYGPRFTLVGAWSPRAEREEDVRRRLSQHHPSQDPSWYTSSTTQLLLRDEKDGARRLGQRVRDTFELADAYIALLPGYPASEQIRRVVDLLFGSPFETPTQDEQAMFHAWGARLRSSDAGRQVGAVITDALGELLVTGANEVPRAGGGQYWAGQTPDYRDFRLGYDINEAQKTELITEVLRRLQDSDWLNDEHASRDLSVLVDEAITTDGPLVSSRIADLLEFGRVAHAEMAAISTAARRGTPIGSSTMYSTTYPCHECARLIIGAGITRLVYIDPYPKSQVPRMYQRQIDDGPHIDGLPPSALKVTFEPFQGIAPRMFADVFAMPERTRDSTTGDYGHWNKAQAPPRLVASAEAVYPLHFMEDAALASLADVPDGDGAAGG